MNADTITISRLANILAVLDMARESVASVHSGSQDGVLSPQEAAADMAEVLATINAAFA